MRAPPLCRGVLALLLVVSSDLVDVASAERLAFAHGGFADFRGVNDTFYDILSAPGHGLAMRTTDVGYLVSVPKYVDGSVFTQAVVTVRGRSERHYEVVMDTSEETVFVLDKGVSDPSSRPVRLVASLVPGRRGVDGWTSDGVSVKQDSDVVCVRGAGWESNVTRRWLRNRMTGPSRWKLTTTVRPIAQGTRLAKVHGYASKTCYPHGLVGQSFDGDGVAVFGNVDDYSYDPKQTSMTTEAMAEGSIEGSVEEYVVVRPFFVRSNRSRYDRRHEDVCSPRDATALSGRRATTAGPVAPVGVVDISSLLHAVEPPPTR